MSQLKVGPNLGKGGSRGVEDFFSLYFSSKIIPIPLTVPQMFKTTLHHLAPTISHLASEDS